MISNGFSNESKPIKAVIICGPTGSGKSSIGMCLAERFKGQIVSADSRQIYRRLDIGTAKPSPEDRARIPHHMIDVVDVTEDFTAQRYAEMAGEAIRRIDSEGDIPIIVGGAGLYLSALTEGLFEGPQKDDKIRQELEADANRGGVSSLHNKLASVDPAAAAQISPSDKVRIIRAIEVYRLTGQTISQLKAEGRYKRLNAQYLWIGLTQPRSELYERINRRVDDMVTQGLVDEVRGLLGNGFGEAVQKKRIVGYYEIADAVQERLPMERAISLVKQHSRNYAKRQMTWFRHKASVCWLTPDSTDFYDKVFRSMDEYLSKRA